MNKLLLACAVAALAPWLASAAPSGPASASGDYTAKLEIKSLKNEKTGRTPTMTFSGHFEHSSSNFRLEVNNDLTAEQQIYMVNGGSKQAWILFPDTLNGISADLSAVDKDNLLQQSQSFMKGQYGSLPESWGKPEKKTEQLNGKTVTHLIYASPKSSGKTKRVDVWHTADNTPVKLVIDSALVKMTVTFDSYTKNPTLPGTRFKPEKSYKLRPLGKDEPFPMPGGVPNLRSKSKSS